MQTVVQTVGKPVLRLPDEFQGMNYKSISDVHEGQRETAVP